MTKRNSYIYEADWRQYAFPEQDSGFASEADLEEGYTTVDLDSPGPLAAGGLPIVSDGRRAIINTENEHTLIYGATASKKTRTLILPLLAILAKAKESMIVLDVKGELSDGVRFPQVRNLLEENGYQCRYFDLRNMEGDGYNILQEPYRLYKEGMKDEAAVMVNHLIEALAGIYRGTSADPFWEKTARQYLASVVMLMFELCDDPRKINLLSLASYTSWDSCEDMKRIAQIITEENNVMTMLRSVTSEPDRTRMSTLATVNSMFTDFVSNDKLLRMLSHSTFDFHELSGKPTALFVIVPDEVDTYAGIVGLMLGQASATLVQDAQKYGGKLPIRVNFLCDEFNNYYIPGMKRSISAHRSRNIRWYLVCQSKKQLESCYPKEADTIIANCTNTCFLNSPELSLMEHLSAQAGFTTVTSDGSPRPILSVTDLQSLKKGWTHTDVYFTAGSTHYVASLPDISGYGFLNKCRKAPPAPRRTFPRAPIYTSSQMVRSARVYASNVKSKQDQNTAELMAELEKKFDKLFASP